MTPELLIESAGGARRTVKLDRDRFVLGRAATADLYYPDDTALSRQHLAITRSNGEWMVEDLQSKNGSLHNGAKLTAPVAFRPGDHVSAGRLTLSFAGGPPRVEQTVFFVPESDPTTFATRLDGVLNPSSTSGLARSDPHMAALIRAGRELSGHRPLEELFELIVGLAAEAVDARRAVLLTGDVEDLTPRAHRGDGFRIPSAVRDRVMLGRESLLIGDAQSDEAFRLQQSIVDQRIRSMLAVPLQTDDRVLGLIYLDTPGGRVQFSKADLNLLTVLANVAAIRIERARLAEVEAAERMLQHELDQASQIQQRLLPAAPPVVEGYDIAGYSVPCRGVGGDYYDFLRLATGELVAVVGDVAGKGMPAALLMSSLQARVQVLFEDAADLSATIMRLNKAVCTNCPQGRFITFFAAVFDPATGAMSYGNAGHNAPILLRADGSMETLDTAGMVLGIMPRGRYEHKATRLAAGDVLVLFSDGVTEAESPAGEEFGEQRLAALAATLRHSPAIEIVHAIHDAVAAFTEGRGAADDITVTVIRRTS